MGQVLNLNGGGVTDDSDYTSVFHTHTFFNKKKKLYDSIWSDSTFPIQM